MNWAVRIAMGSHEQCIIIFLTKRRANEQQDEGGAHQPVNPSVDVEFAQGSFGPLFLPLKKNEVRPF